MLDEPGGQLGARGEPQLRHSICNMRFDGPAAQDESLCDFPVRQAIGDEPGDFDLARSQGAVA